MLQVGLLEITAHGGFVRLLVHQIAVNLHSKVCVLCLRALELEFRVQRLSLQGRVAQLHNDGIWPDDSPGAQHPAVHARVRLRSDPPDVFWHQRSQATPFHQHGAALHFIRPDRGPVHAWRGRPQLGESIGYPSHEEERDGAVDDPSNLLGASVRWPLDIHILSLSRTQLSGPRFPSLSIFCFNGLAGILLPKSPQIDRKWDSPSHLRTSTARSLSPITLDCTGRT